MASWRMAVHVPHGTAKMMMKNYHVIITPLEHKYLKQVSVQVALDLHHHESEAAPVGVTYPSQPGHGKTAVSHCVCWPRT